MIWRPCSKVWGCSPSYKITGSPSEGTAMATRVSGLPSDTTPSVSVVATCPTHAGSEHATILIRP